MVLHGILSNILFTMKYKICVTRIKQNDVALYNQQKTTSSSYDISPPLSIS